MLTLFFVYKSWLVIIIIIVIAIFPYFLFPNVLIILKEQHGSLSFTTR